MKNENIVNLEIILSNCEIKQGSRALDCLQNGVNSANISQLFGNLFFAKTKPIYSNTLQTFTTTNERNTKTTQSGIDFFGLGLV